MPNSYNFAPGLIIGNLTVTGDEIKIGKAAPFFRAGKDTGGQGFISINFDPASSAFDNIAARGTVHTVRTDALIETCVPNKSGAIGTTLTYDYVIAEQQARQTVTGTTVEQTLVSFSFQDNFIASKGGFSLRLFFSTSAQGAVASVVRIKFALLNLHSQSFTSSPGQTNWVGVIQANQALTAVFSELFILSSVVGTLGPFEDTVAADLTVGQTFAVTLQLGATTDNWVFEGFRMDGFVPQAALP